jgi:hypothetical protein
VVGEARKTVVGEARKTVVGEVRRRRSAQDGGRTLEDTGRRDGLLVEAEEGSGCRTFLQIRDMDVTAVGKSSVMATRTAQTKPPNGDALDQLEFEDRTLLKVLDDFDDAADRLEHGMAGKLFVEHLAVREAAREAAARALLDEPAVSDLAQRLEDGIVERRQALTKLEELARGVQPIILNQGQDFDAVVERVGRSLRSEIRRDLEELLPELGARMSAKLRQSALPSSRRVRQHAPTHPNPAGRQWYERFGPVVWVHALYDWIRGFPTGGPKPSSQVDIPTEDDY